ncbi:MAG: hypothetical protein WBA09_22140 [Candidatus Acidiferrum sp.]
MPDKPLGDIVRELAAAREKATPQRGQFVWVEGQIVHGDQPSDFPKRARIHIHGIGTGIPLAFKPVEESAVNAIPELSRAVERLEKLAEKWEQEAKDLDYPGQIFGATHREHAAELRAITGSMLRQELGEVKVSAKESQRKRGDDGRFEHEGNWERLCVCGHTLGVHAAASPAQCLFYTFSPSAPERLGKPGENNPDCGCQRFRLSRKQ